MEPPSTSLPAKISAAPKKSLFDRQRAEASAKQARDQAETAAIYDDFVKSFDQDDSQHDQSGGFATGKRHFKGNHGGKDSRGMPKSGPGSLGPSKTGPGSLSQPARKRLADGSEVDYRDRGRGMIAFSDPIQDEEQPGGDSSGEAEPSAGRQTIKRQERPVTRPTIHLANLPPGMSLEQIKNVLPTDLPAANIRLLPVRTGTDRKSQSAIVHFAPDTPVSEVDSAVASRQNTYLGYGHYLTLSRQSSSASTLAAPSLAVLRSDAPFDAQPVPTGPISLGRAPPPRGFAPPISYHTAIKTPTAPLMQVSVKVPTDLGLVRLIHKTIESILQYGLEYESLLMSRTEVQREERWAWLWNARSEGGIWYRWRLWEIITRSACNGRQKGMPAFVFENGTAWVPPKDGLPMEFITQLEEVIEEDEYESENTDDSEDEMRQKQATSSANNASPETDVRKHLTPIRLARLVHLLASLPSSTAKLRRGDVANLMAFAINNAEQGAEDVVDLMVKNVRHPFSYTSASNDRPVFRGHSGLADLPQGKRRSSGDPRSPERREDTSSASQIALFVISDILSSSSTCGIRHAWRYRSLFESRLLRARTLFHLGVLDKAHGWGRLKAEKWKRSISHLLNLWEGWCVFSGDAMEQLKSQFTESDKLTEETEHRKLDTQQPKGPFNPVKPAGKVTGDQEYALVEAEEVLEDLDGEPMDDLDGEPMEDVDSEPSAGLSLNDELMESAPEEDVKGDDDDLPSEVTKNLMQPEDSESDRTISDMRPEWLDGSQLVIEDMFGPSKLHNRSSETAPGGQVLGEVGQLPDRLAGGAPEGTAKTSPMLRRQRARAADLF